MAWSRTCRAGSTSTTWSTKAARSTHFALDFFKRLLENLKLDPEIATALVDWIDADINETLPGGAEDGAYLLAVPPYRAANRPLVDISELRLVQGYTPEVITALAPHVTALPDEHRDQCQYRDS